MVWRRLGVSFNRTRWCIIFLLSHYSSPCFLFASQCFLSKHMPLKHPLSYRPLPLVAPLPSLLHPSPAQVSTEYQSTKTVLKPQPSHYCCSTSLVPRGGGAGAVTSRHFPGLALDTQPNMNTPQTLVISHSFPFFAVDIAAV